MKIGWKIWVLIIFLVFSLLAIFGFPPTFLQKGVFVSSIEANSTAFEQGLRQNQIIIELDGQKIENLEDKVTLSGEDGVEVVREYNSISGSMITELVK